MASCSWAWRARHSSRFGQVLKNELSSFQGRNRSNSLYRRLCSSFSNWLKLMMMGLVLRIINLLPDQWAATRGLCQISSPAALIINWVVEYSFTFLLFLWISSGLACLYDIPYWPGVNSFWEEWLNGKYDYGKWTSDYNKHTRPGQKYNLSRNQTKFYMTRFNIVTSCNCQAQPQLNSSSTQTKAEVSISSTWSTHPEQ